MNYKERNRTITVSVLEGTTLNEISKVYGISETRAKQIVLNYCRRDLFPSSDGIWKNRTMEGVDSITKARRVWVNFSMPKN